MIAVHRLFMTGLFVTAAAHGSDEAAHRPYESEGFGVVAESPLNVPFAELPGATPDAAGPPAEAQDTIRWNADDLSWRSENRFLTGYAEEAGIIPNPRWRYVEIVEDPTVPHHGPLVLGRLYREGAPAGHGFGLRRHLPEGGSRVLHMGVLLKIDENFVNDAANLTKIFYLWSNSKSKAILSVIGGQNFDLGFNLRHAPGVVPGYLMANVAPREQARLTPGQWHVVEFRVESATAPEMGDAAGRVAAPRRCESAPDGVQDRAP